MNKKEILDFLSTSATDTILFKESDKIRHQTVGNTVHLRGLIEFSNICKCRCQYCGLRCLNRNIQRYRLSLEQIIAQATLAAQLGYKTIVLQSGEDDYYTIDRVCQIIQEIKKLGVALTISMGEKTFAEYKAYREAGADRYLIRIETTDKELYAKMHPCASFKDRLRCLEDLKKLGYEVGTGCLIGLPGQSLDSLANDILFFKEIEADMIGIGPLIPHPDTPLKNVPAGNFTLALKVMALTRLVLPKINIPATTAMETLHPNGRLIALQSGANVVMPNVSPSDCRLKYEIYPGKCGEERFVNKYKEEKEAIEIKIKSIGRTIGTDSGSARH